MSDWSQDCEDLFAAGRMIDEPSAEDHQRVALRIAAQVAAAATGTAIVSLTTAAGTAGTTAATVSTAAKVATGLSMTKLLISAAVAVGAVGVVTTAVVKSSASRARVAQVTTQTEAAQTVSAPVASAWSQPHSRSMEVPPVEDVPPPVTPATAVAPLAPIASSVPARKAMATPSAETPETLATAAAAPVATEDTASEARLVRSIDDAIRRHDGPTAQRLLDEHDAAFPHGHFGEECSAARLLARCDGTPTDDARHAACTFFTQHPRSPMRARIEEACAPRCDLSR